ncbi:MAG: hypothetical protein M3R72_08130 [Bacteroidota bacterium]|nr:hypothetical protein [Bacteroidota bacterium]
MKLAEKNILVFEFVETWNKKEKANIHGFFKIKCDCIKKTTDFIQKRNIYFRS